MPREHVSEMFTSTEDGLIAIVPMYKLLNLASTTDSIKIEVQGEYGVRIEKYIPDFNPDLEAIKKLMLQYSDRDKQEKILNAFNELQEIAKSL